MIVNQNACSFERIKKMLLHFQLLNIVIIYICIKYFTKWFKNHVMLHCAIEQ